MATRSEVYIQEADGSLRGCYIRNDSYPAKLDEWRSPDTSFEEATRTFNQLLDSYRSDDWQILYHTDEQFIAKSGATVAMVNKI